MILEMPNLPELILELNNRGIKEIRLFSYYKSEPAVNVGSFTTFYIKLTAKVKDPNFVENDIILLEEGVGRDITAFEDKMKEIAAKTAARIEEIKKVMAKEKIKVKMGVWRL